MSALTQLHASPVGSLVPVEAPGGTGRETMRGQAFLPDPLPRELTFSTETWNTVNGATAALARLDGAARLIPNPDLLRGPTLRREAQSTSALEGTYAPIVDVLAADAEDPASLSAELVEVLNFETMAELAFSWPEDRPLTIGMLGQLQRTLVAGTSGELSDAGGLRDRLVMIGTPGTRLDGARFVPPPPGDRLRAGVEALLGWVNGPPAVPTVVQAALTHYQFETLHPFSDGNGRLGRLLVIVQLLGGAVIREPLLVVSPWFEQRRTQYQDALLALSRSGDWNGWVAFFAAGVAASAAESQQKVEQLLLLQGTLRTRVQDAGRRGAAERVAADLVGQPFVTGPGIARRYDLSSQGAMNVVRALIELGILDAPAHLRARRSQLYRAPEVLRILA